MLRMHRTRAGVIPYTHVQFGRLEKLPLFRLDGRPDKDFAVRVPSTFRDSLEMM